MKQYHYNELFLIIKIFTFIMSKDIFISVFNSVF